MKPKILLVDDEINNLILLNGILSSLDIEIVEATNGAEALEIVKTNEIALIISDVQMPEMSGFQLLENVRKFEELKFLPVMFISAIYTEEKHILKGISTGAIDFISKPFNHSILLGKVEALIQIYHQKKKLDDVINELNNKNKELVESKKLIDQITNSAYDGIIMINQNCTIIFWNQAAEKIFGYSTHEIVNRNFSKLISKNNHSDEILNVIADFFTLSKGKPLNKAFELEGIRKNEDKFPVEFSLSSLEIDDKLHVVCIARDISERKENERKILKAKEHKESNKVMSDFLDNISHELSTPLNSINGILKDIIRKPGKLENEQLEGLKLAYSSAKRLESIINNILQFKNKYVIRHKTILLSDIVKELEEFCHEVIKKDELTYSIHVNLSDPNITIRTDANKLLVSIYNLIENAIKYTQKGHIDIDFEQENEKLIICIIDQGIGMSLKDLESVFEMFNQLETSNDRKFQGVGLGLAVVKQNIEALGGKLSIESEVNKGTKVKIEIPID